MDWQFHYPSQRMTVHAENIVATSQPLAAQAGLQMLRDGGNAVDAAIATAICLTVVEPTSNGIGSDAFAIIWDGDKIHGLNASGRSPLNLDPSKFIGSEKMPKYGWDAVTVPGCVKAWVELSQRFGALSFQHLFEPAIRYAQKGFLISPITGKAWHRAAEQFKDYKDFQSCFCPGGSAPRIGGLFKNEDQARTLGIIAESEGESFYSGYLAEQIVACAQNAGVDWSMDDLAQHQNEWVEPVAQRYGEWDLLEIPPNGQGIAAQICLGILQHFPMQEIGISSTLGVHLQIEAMKLAFADAFRYVADSNYLELSAVDLLHEERLKKHAASINKQEAQFPEMDPINDHGTVYLSTADANGMMVSFIQSNFWGFGSGIVVPGTGISMQNRGFGFSTVKGHPNVVAPGKRPFHTIIPGFIMKDNQPLSSFGVMGGHMQAQGHVQMMLRMHDVQANPQCALDAPRWMVDEDNKRVHLEPGFSEDIINGLKAMGHELELADALVYGGGQIIVRQEHGYCAGSDPRKDGCAVGF